MNDAHGNTLNPFSFKWNLSDYRDKPLDEVIKEVLEELCSYRNMRFEYYSNLRRKESKWVNSARKWLASLGTAAVFVSAFASIISLLQQQIILGYTTSSISFSLACFSLLAYAIIGAISFYERTTDKTNSYFRHLLIVASIRDLWNKFEFAVLKIVLETGKGDDAAVTAARERLRVLAEAFCNDLNKVGTDELAQWKTELVASLAEIEDAAKKGGEAVGKTLQSAITEAKEAAEKASKAAAAAEQALKPAVINLKIEGDIEGDVTVLVDGQDVMKTHLRMYPIDGLRPGLRKLEARAMKGETLRAAAKMVELKSGPQDIVLLLI